MKEQDLDKIIEITDWLIDKLPESALNTTVDSNSTGSLDAGSAIGLIQFIAKDLKDK